MTCKKVTSGFFDPRAAASPAPTYPLDVTVGSGTVTYYVPEQRACREGCATCTAFDECTACIPGYKYTRFVDPRDPRHGFCTFEGLFDNDLENLPSTYNNGGSDTGCSNSGGNGTFGDFMSGNCSKCTPLTPSSTEQRQWSLRGLSNYRF
jgi:hypothetical protein